MNKLRRYKKILAKGKQPWQEKPKIKLWWKKYEDDKQWGYTAKF